MAEVDEWLEQLGLGDYAPLFAENDIDLDVLPDLTDEDLKQLGISLGHRKKLLRAIAELAPAAHGSPASAPDRALEGGAASGPAAEPERRQLTVLFCDLVGSTALAARLDLEDMREVIRAYQACCVEIIQGFDGHVARFMGDGVLAYFGYPSAHEDDAERAVRAGLALAEALGRMSAGDTQLAARVGIATGRVVVGEKEVVVGETPNLAARLQTLAEPGGVVIARSTRQLVGEWFDLIDLGEYQMKGFADPVPAWRVLSESGAEGRFEALRGRRLTPLVGREHELGILLERWTWAKEGEGQVVLLSGEPGIGKSRLIRALREQLAHERYTPLVHHCSPYYQSTALYPVIGRLKRAAGLTRDDSPEHQLEKLEALFALSGRDLSRVMPLIADLLELPTGERYPPLDLSPEHQKERTLAELVAQLEALAAREPVLLVVEDLHWIDPTTFELMDRTVERVRGLAIMVLMTERPERRTSWVGFPHVTVLTLNRLGRHQGADMALEVAGGKSLPGEVLDQIVERTDGVPLFVEELTKAILESGLLTDLGDRYELAAPLPAFAIPATLQDSLMARLDRLAPVREVAQIGAVIGREFGHELLAAVAGLSAAQLEAALDRLVGSGLLFRTGRPPEATYTFKHALVQDAAYQSLLKSRRQQLHARIGHVLETAFPEIKSGQPEIIAQHCAAGGLDDKAIEYWRLAGQHAAERSSNAEAVVHFKNALRVLPLIPESPERDRLEVDILAALGSALIATTGHADQEVDTVYSRARILCRRRRDDAHLAEVLQGLRHAYLGRGELRAAKRVSEELLRFAERTDDDSHRLEGHRALASVWFFTGDFEAALRHAEAGILLYDPARHGTHAFRFEADPGATCLAYAGLTLWALGYPEQAEAKLDQGLVLARELAHAYTIAEVHWWQALLFQLCRDAPRASEAAQATLDIAAEHHFPLWSAAATAVRGWVLIEQGDGEAGLAEMRGGVSALITRYKTQQPQHLGFLAEAHVGLGQVLEALECVREALDLIERTGERFWKAELLRIKGRILDHAAYRDHAEAEATLASALELARAQKARSLELRSALELARLLAEQGRRAEAHDLLVPVYGWFTEGFDTQDLKEAKALLENLA